MSEISFATIRTNSTVPAPKNSGFQLFKRCLTVVPADSTELLDHVFRLRFQVYCVERGFENAAEHPDGRERDRDDRRSRHFLVLDRVSGAPAGTVRLILPQPGNDLPVLRLTGARKPGLALPFHTTAEVSRFAVSKTVRRRLETGWHMDRGGRTALPIITFGLIQAVVTMSAHCGITHIVAMMEPALLRMLRRLSIEFHPIGELVHHHGLRQPGWAVLSQLAERVRECHRELWEIATDGMLFLPRPSASAAVS